MSILSKPYFHDEAAAFAHLEAVLWPNGPVCPHCGAMGRIGKIKPNPAKRVRIGLRKCGDCGKQFTVKVGTVFEHGRIPLHKMLQAVHLMMASKKGVSAHQLHRILDVQYRTAWFMGHRLHEAMRSGELAPIAAATDLTRTEYGAVEGFVTSASTWRGKPSLVIKHRLSGAPITCVFDAWLASEIGDAYSWSAVWTHHRVLVSGAVHHNFNGHIERIEVNRIVPITSKPIALDEFVTTQRVEASELAKWLEDSWGDSGG